MSKYGSFLLLIFFCTMTQAKATTITVFTNKWHPIDTLGMDVRYYEIDGVQPLINQLNSSLTGLTKAEARMAIEAFLNRHSPELLKGAKGLAKMQQLNLTQFPAIIFDNQAVIYGQTNLTVALAEYSQWQKTAP